MGKFKMLYYIIDVSIIDQSYEFDSIINIISSNKTKNNITILVRRIINEFFEQELQVYMEPKHRSGARNPHFTPLSCLFSLASIQKANRKLFKTILNKRIVCVRWNSIYVAGNVFHVERRT